MAIYNLDSCVRRSDERKLADKKDAPVGAFFLCRVRKNLYRKMRDLRCQIFGGVIQTTRYLF